MEFILIAICIGLIPAAIAQSKGKSFIAWWLYGAALFIVALPIFGSIFPAPQASDLPASTTYINIGMKSLRRGYLPPIRMRVLSHGMKLKLLAIAGLAVANGYIQSDQAGCFPIHMP